MAKSSLLVPQPQTLPRPVVDAAPAGAAIGRTFAIACIGILLLLMASTIVLSLIPVYLPKKDISDLAGSGTKYAILTTAGNVPPYGAASLSTCATIASSMLAASNGKPASVSVVSCGFGTSASNGRRRRSPFSRRLRQTQNANLYAIITLNYASCPACRNSRSLNKYIGFQFSSTFEYYGSRTATFTITSISNTNYGSIVTESTTTTTTAATG